MSAPQFVVGGYCKQCGASWKLDATQCWMCHGHERASDADEPGVADGDGPHATPQAEQSTPFQYGLGSLLLVATLIAILCSVTRISPKAGILLTVLCIPALLRTCLSALSRQAQGDPLSLRGQVMTFLATLGFLVAVLVAALVAFALTLLVTRAVGTFAAGAPGFVVLVLLYGGMVALVDAVVNSTFSSKAVHGRQDR